MCAPTGSTCTLWPTAVKRSGAHWRAASPSRVLPLRTTPYRAGAFCGNFNENRRVRMVTGTSLESNLGSNTTEVHSTYFKQGERTVTTWNKSDGSSWAACSPKRVNGYEDRALPLRLTLTSAGGPTGAGPAPTAGQRPGGVGEPRGKRQAEGHGTVEDGGRGRSLRRLYSSLPLLIFNAFGARRTVTDRVDVKG